MKASELIEELMGYEDCEVEVSVLSMAKNGWNHDIYSVEGVEEAYEKEKVIVLGIEYKGGN